MAGTLFKYARVREGERLEAVKLYGAEVRFLRCNDGGPADSEKLKSLAVHKSRLTWMGEFRGLAIGTKYGEGLCAHGYLSDFKLLP